MELRHEVKHNITYGEMLTLESRLGAVMGVDSHYKDGIYRIRSLYFDDLADTALYEKLDGVSPRSKYRIRFYNGDTSYIMLEKKSKISGLCKKEQQRISEKTARLFVKRDVSDMICFDDLSGELARKMKNEGLIPKATIEYTRKAFVFPAGGVRVTLDRDISVTNECDGFLKDPLLIPVEGSVLEVKWNEFLPDVIRDAVALGGCMEGAFSKYAAGRMFG